jgi:hypothetical protein
MSYYQRLHVSVAFCHHPQDVQYNEVQQKLVYDENPPHILYTKIWRIFAIHKFLLYFIILYILRMVAEGDWNT